MMWAHVSGSLLLTGRGFGSGPPPWSFPEAITLIAPALPSVTSCDCSGAGRAAALSWKPFPFSELWLRGIGYCPAFEKETVHESSPDHGAGSPHGPNQHNPQLCPRDRMRLQCHLHMPIHLNMGIRCAGLCAEKDHVVHCCSDLNIYAQEIKS